MRTTGTEPQDTRRMHRRLQTGLTRGLFVGVIAGAIVGLVVGLIWSSPSRPAFWMAVVGFAVFGLAFGGLLGGYGSLESPDPGREPSDTEHPLEERALTREEHPANPDR